MSFMKISLVGAVIVMGMLQQAWAQSAADNDPKSLAELMNKHGIRKTLQLDQRPDLSGLMNETQARAKSIYPDCDVNTISEVHVVDGHEWIAGYEAYLYCEDSPAPAVGLYYDVNQNYLDALSLTD